MSGKRSDKKTLLYILLVVICVILIIIILNAMLSQKAEPQAVAVSSSDDFISFLDVGQGDGALLKSGEKTAVIDTGTPEGAADFCEKLKNMGVNSIKTMLLSHNHDDHIGGSAAVSGMFNINSLILPDITNTKSPTRIIGTVSSDVNGQGGSVVTAKSGVFYDIGNIKLTVLCCYSEFSNENERSIICIAQLGSKKFLFTGDAGKQAESRMIKDGIDVDCDVLKAGHHGSKGSSSAEFLAIASPEYAVISCGKVNQYGHPHDEAVSRMINAGAKILRTDQNGDITFFVIDNILDYKTEK